MEEIPTSVIENALNRLHEEHKQIMDEIQENNECLANLIKACDIVGHVGRDLDYFTVPEANAVLIVECCNESQIFETDITNFKQLFCTENRYYWIHKDAAEKYKIE